MKRRSRSRETAVTLRRNHRSRWREIRNFAKFIDSARAEVADHINLLVNTVGNTGDISDIVICGGGAKFFTPLFKKRFPHNNITYRADSQFEVVNGLYAMGLIAFAKVADKSETKEAA